MEKHPTQAERLYRRLLTLLPAEIREDFGDDMTALFLDRLQEASGRRARFWVWLRALADVTGNGVRERLPVRRGERPGVSTGSNSFSSGSNGSQRRNRRHSMRELFRDFRYALRGLLQNPTFTVVSIVTLALGIGATTVSFSLVNGILIRPLHFPEPDRLVLLMEEAGSGRELMLSYPNFEDWRARSRSFEGLAAIQFANEVSVLGGEEPARASAVVVSRDFFDVVGVQPLLGRPILPEENRPGGRRVAVVSYELWQRALGGRRDLDAMSLTAWGAPYSVVGVMPPGFKLFEEVDLYLPMELHPASIRSAHNYRGVGRLAEGVSLERADDEMDRLAEAIREEHGDDSDAVAVAMRPLQAEVVGEAGRPLLLLLGAAGLLLLIACTNQASTLLARGTHRQREMAIRTAVGAARRRLVQLLLAESALLAAVGGLTGVGLTHGTLLVLKATGPDLIPRLDAVSIEGEVLLFAVAATLVTSLLFGLVPALRTSGDVAQSLRGGQAGAAAQRTSRGWNLLVGGEVAMAVVLVVASGLLVRSLAEILTLDTHFRADGVLTMELDLSGQGYGTEETRIAFYQDLAGELATLPGVSSVGYVNRLPTDFSDWTGPVLRSPVTDRESRDEWVAIAGWRPTDGDYFRALGIPLLRGRLFSPEEDRVGGPPVAILNESLARRAFPEEDPIGKQVQALWDRREEDFTVVGVVAEARDWRRDEGSQPELYVYWPQRSEAAWTMTAVMHTDGNPAALVGPARDRLGAIAPELPGRILTMDTRIAESLKERNFTLAVLAAFAGLSLLLAAVGIYGVVSYSVSRRTREIGIRLALGAEPITVRRGIFGRALWVVAVGAGVGLTVAIVTLGVMESLLFGVSPRDPWALLAALLLLLAAATLAIGVPVLRYTRVDPAVTMRAE